MSQNGILDESSIIGPQETVVDEDILQEERKMATFAKSKEFERLKDHLESRIAFYKQYLPDGRALTDVDEAERGRMWLVATTIINEFDLVLSTYENALEAVKSAKRQG